MGEGGRWREREEVREVEVREGGRGKERGVSEGDRGR